MFMFRPRHCLRAIILVRSIKDHIPLKELGKKYTHTLYQIGSRTDVSQPFDYYPALHKLSCTTAY